MGHGDCCEHCDTIVTLDLRLDAIALSLATITEHVELMKKLVYGTVAAVLTSAVTFGASKLVLALWQ